MTYSVGGNTVGQIHTTLREINWQIWQSVYGQKGISGEVFSDFLV